MRCGVLLRFVVRCYGALCCVVPPCAVLYSAAVICDAMPCYATLCDVSPYRDICYAGASSEMVPKRSMSNALAMLRLIDAMLHHSMLRHVVRCSAI